MTPAALWGSGLPLHEVTVAVACLLAVALAVIDTATHRLPDPLVAILAGWTLAGLGAQALTGDPAPLVRGSISAAVVLVVFFVLACLVRDGLGLGDVKLAAALTLSLGWEGTGTTVGFLLVALSLNGIVAATALVVHRCRRRTGNRTRGPATEVAMGPSLVLAAAVCWCGLLL